MKDPPETIGVWMRSTPCRLTLLSHHSPAGGGFEVEQLVNRRALVSFTKVPFLTWVLCFLIQNMYCKFRNGFEVIFFSLWEVILSLIPTFSPPLVCFGLWQIVSRLCKISLAWESLTSRPINLSFNYLTNQLLGQWIWEAHSLPLGQDLIVASFIIRNQG